MLIAIADNDDQKEPTSKDVLRRAFEDAKVSAEIAVYRGPNHGFNRPFQIGDAGAGGQNHRGENAPA
jgi:dienelactone hydrolase